jgi:hypothetical protein
MKDKTIDCLKLCSMPIMSDERESFKKEICCKYSCKAIFTKLNELWERDYIGYGTFAFGAWLTEKGKKTLRENDKEG